MKKRYRLKEKWGIVIFYAVLVIETLIYVSSMK